MDDSPGRAPGEAEGSVLGGGSLEAEPVLKRLRCGVDGLRKGLLVRELEQAANALIEDITLLRDVNPLTHQCCGGGGSGDDRLTLDVT